MSSLKLSNIHKSFGDVPVIKGVNLDIQDGEFIVFVGPSGCGKSTLLRLIAGLEDISSGEMRIADRVVNELEPKERGIAMVFQSYAIFPHMSVKENMAFGLTVRKEDKREIDQRVNEAARILKMEDLLERRPSQLSGGQRQRVAIGRAIVRNPDVFLFDEPLSNLDASLRMNTRMEIAALHKRLGTTMIYVTHDQVEAMTLADRIVVLKEGEVQQFGKPMELYHSPANKFVAQFIGSPAMNMFEGRILEQNGDIMVDCQGIGPVKLESDPGYAQEKVAVGLRPQYVSLTQSALKPNRVSATILYLERLGDETIIGLQLNDGITMVALVPMDVELRVAEQIDVWFGHKDLRIFPD